MEPFDTRISLKEYFDEQLKSLRDAFVHGREEVRTYFNMRLDSFDAIVKATECRLQQYFDIRLKNLETSFEDYRESIVREFVKVNEFRGALSDVINVQASSKDLTTAIASLQAENKHLLELLHTKANDGEVRAQIEGLSTKVNGQIQNNAANIRTLETYKATMEGKASQTSVMIALAFSVVGVILTLINMFG